MSVSIKDKHFMPICVDVNGKMILVIGGGKVALHKLKTISLYADKIKVIAPEIHESILASGCISEKRAYNPSDLDSAFLVYACTDDRALNHAIARDAMEKRVLVNVCDDASHSAFVSPAVYNRDGMSVAVSSNGSNVKRSLRWRDKIRELLDHDNI